MMSALKIYHNPRCSKSRATLQLLRDRDLDPQVIEYLQTPPSAEDLGNILSMLGLEPRELVRVKEGAYAETGIGDPTLGREEVIAKMVANPSVIERPIVVCGDRAAIGRPPENVLQILDAG